MAAERRMAGLYDTQGKYAHAEPLNKRSLAIVEKTLGPDHPNVATTLENFAELLRKMDRDAEAEKLEAALRPSAPSTRKRIRPSSASNLSCAG